MKKLIPLCVLLFAGCSNIPTYKAEEVHQVISYPGFSSEIHATGIRKETNEDGSVVRKAEQLTHTTNVLGFGRTAVYKEAEIVTKE